MILDGAGVDALRQQAIADGMQTLREAALDLARQGLTTLQDIDRALGESGRVTRPAATPAASSATETSPGDTAGGEAPLGEVSADQGDDAVRVLLADDDPIIRQIARTLLLRDGFAVIEVEDGVAALERLNSDHPNDHVDLMISDLDMPRLNGRDLLRLARGTPRTAALPIIVLTGEEEPETEAKLIEGGADDYIRKPIDPVRFLARVKAVLRRAGG